MSALAKTYQHIADILSFETSARHLKQTLSNPSFDWDAIVIEGSKHLLLPALYCRLKAKELLTVLPEDLTRYLQEITALNRERNEAISHQVNTIATLFNKHHINHTFLKGSALLVHGCFDDIAERMIGDIDILIELSQLDFAFNLLTQQNYQPISQTLGSDFFEHRHLPRLTTTHAICAVELHRKLFTSFIHPELQPKNLLRQKRVINTICIPSQDHLLLHNILNAQINDNGTLYNHVNFRSAYDSISLLRNYKDHFRFIKNRYIQNYFNFTGLFFKDITIKIPIQSNSSTAFYLFKLKHLSFYKFWNKIIYSYDTSTTLLNRIYVFLTHARYRQAILKDHNRISKHLKSLIKKS